MTRTVRTPGPSRDEAPAISAFPDYEVIVPPNRLKKAVTRAWPGAAEDDPVARAEAALAGISHEFSAWMDAARDELFRAAHDIKGEAETFGFPYAGRVADSLCRLIEHTPDPVRIPLALVTQHVDAVRAIIRETRAGTTDEVAATLTRRLRQVTDDFLAHENRDRPGALDGIVAPPLNPGERG